MSDWRTHEPIAKELGGGLIVKGPFGCLHLVGAAWAWWRCSTCRAAQQHVKEAADTAALMERETA